MSFLLSCLVPVDLEELVIQLMHHMKINLMKLIDTSLLNAALEYPGNNQGD